MDIPPLLFAELRAKRARQLIGTLKRQLQAWADAHEGFIELREEARGKVALAVARGDAARLGRIGITCGEIIYNLRAALDYVIHDLAWIGAGKQVKGTQFPIEDSPGMFRARLTGKTPRGKPAARFLQSVPPPCLPLIERLQPYMGCKWTALLRSLSNPDKHRHLALLRSELTARVKGSKILERDPETGQGSLRVDYDAEVEVFFADGQPVLETLQDLCDEVEAAIALFKRGIKTP